MTPRSDRRNRWGTVFLGFAALGFTFFALQPWWPPESVRFVRAFFEASLVGALADWFAVTALFHRPLGIPLPHTDILVRQKDQIVDAIPRFLGSFLEPAHLHPLLRNLDWAELLLTQGDPRTLDALVESGLEVWLTAPSRAAWEQRAISLGADLIHRELVRHRDTLVGPATALIKKNAGWKGLFVSRESVDEMIEGFLQELAALRDQPHHELRRTMTTAFHDALPRLVEQLKPSVWTAATWKRLETDPVFRQDFNRRAGDLVVAAWERSGVTPALISGLRFLLDQTDARQLSDRIERAVGNDLQYIRVNGALVGGLAGLALEGLKAWLSG